MVRYYNILNIGMSSLKMIGQKPGQSKFGTVFAMYTILSTMYFYYLVFMKLKYMNGNVSLLAKCVESLATFSQISIKLIPLVIYKPHLTHLLDNMKNFWDVDKFPSLLKQNERTFMISHYFQKIYSFTTFSTLFLYWSQPYFSGELLILAHVPDYPYAFRIILAAEYLSTATVALCMTGFDNVYVTMCTHLVVQLRIVNKVISEISLNDEDYLLKFKTCIEYHRFLLRYATMMLKIYSISMLGQYLLSIYLTCMELYLLTETLESFSQIYLISSYTSYLSCLLFQMALYCFPATEVTEQASRLGDAIYNSKWYDGPISRQKNVVFVIQRAQKDYIFKAAGLADINREAFTVIFKASMSFYTLLNNLKEK